MISKKDVVHLAKFCMLGIIYTFRIHMKKIIYFFLILFFVSIVPNNFCGEKKKIPSLQISKKEMVNRKLCNLIAAGKVRERRLSIKCRKKKRVKKRNFVNIIRKKDKT